MAEQKMQHVELESDAFVKLPQVPVEEMSATKEQSTFPGRVTIAPDLKSEELFPTLPPRAPTSIRAESKHPKSLCCQIPTIFLGPVPGVERKKKNSITAEDQKGPRSRKEAERSSTRPHRGYKYVEERGGPKIVVLKKNPVAPQKRVQEEIKPMSAQKEHEDFEETGAVEPVPEVKISKTAKRKEKKQAVERAITTRSTVLAEPIIARKRKEKKISSAQTKGCVGPKPKIGNSVVDTADPSSAAVPSPIRSITKVKQPEPAQKSQSKSARAVGAENGLNPGTRDSTSKPQALSAALEDLKHPRGTELPEGTQARKDTQQETGESDWAQVSFVFKLLLVMFFLTALIPIAGDLARSVRGRIR